ncbi:hypothetical protein [Agrilutibacter solisilvae]|uniref:Uncharacterized protein n=1 Tax=Agrilutibacter solisilvae TaxID=2763317 RepID=A0A974Y2M9_9GAMM|nr:hypothetical protein [Lysobacter solisilvae]QSX79320.1 hypothetical protein I8J32_005465 [Lysobacter solisilvae]
MEITPVNLRNLLLDCRTALRKADKNFEQSALRELLDDTIIALGESRDRQQLVRRAGAQDAPAAQRVAYAWQSVTRELRHSHPALFQELSTRVLKRLDTEVIGDASDEIQALEDELRLRDTQESKAVAELSALRAALANAVPLADTVGGSEAALAQERMQILLQAVSTGGGLRKQLATPESGHAPTRTTLQAVVDGQRALSTHEREWCIGEAMVLTGFQQTPAQLLSQGEAALARLVLDGKPAG